MLILLILLIIFSNQYLLINEEFFIILAFFSLCYLVKTNLGNIVENELSDRKNKILTSYLEYLNKKSVQFNQNNKNIEQKINYLYNYTLVQDQYFEKFHELFELFKTQNLIDLNKSTESSFIYYFAGFVSQKRKFI